MVPGGGGRRSKKQGAEHTLGGGVRGAGLELVDGDATSGAKDGSFGCLSGYMISKTAKCHDLKSPVTWMRMSPTSSRPVSSDVNEYTAGSETSSTCCVP